MRRIDIRKLRQVGVRALLVLSIVLGLGCAAGDQRDRALQDTLDAYQALIRWGDFGGAMLFVHPDHIPEQREAELIMERFAQIQINGYAVKSRSPGPDENTYLQTAEISFANRHNMVVRTTHDPQVWRWQQDRERWMLVSGLPDITRR